MISIVVPTVGRESLAGLLDALATQVDDRADDRVDVEILLVDDRPETDPPLPVPAALTPYTRPLRGRVAGPAAARNVGWRAARHPWIAFLDDDVVPAPDWLRELVHDLRVDDRVGGVQGNLRVPLPTTRRPTDWERVTAGLADGRWITADMAYRREALAAVGGFDERFPRAYREDTELAHRIRRAGWRLTPGRRWVTHPVRPESRWISLRTQRGNADDALLRRLYGPGWRSALEIPPGRRHRHAVVTAAGTLALAALATLAVPSVRRTGTGRAPGTTTLLGVVVPGAAALGAVVWSAGTAEFAWRRIAPGPRTPEEVIRMLVTSVAIPPLASAYWLRGWWRSRGERPLGGVPRRVAPAQRAPENGPGVAPPRRTPAGSGG